MTGQLLALAVCVTASVVTIVGHGVKANQTVGVGFVSTGAGVALQEVNRRREGSS